MQRRSLFYTLMSGPRCWRSGLLCSLADHGSIVYGKSRRWRPQGAFFWRGNGRVSTRAFDCGFSSMVPGPWSSFLAYQSAYGYVYERIGLLAAAFMGGQRRRAPRSCGT